MLPVAIIALWIMPVTFMDRRITGNAPLPSTTRPQTLPPPRQAHLELQRLQKTTATKATTHTRAHTHTHTHTHTHAHALTHINTHACT